MMGYSGSLLWNLNCTERGFNFFLRGLEPELCGLLFLLRGLNPELRGLNPVFRGLKMKACF